MQAAQAFFACEKNEMMAANFLFENAESLREEMEGDPSIPHAHAHAPRVPLARPSSIPPPPSSLPPHPPAEVKKEEPKPEEKKP